MSIRRIFILFIFLAIPGITQANQEEDVKEWAQKVLLKTLTINYTDTDQKIEQSRHYYLRNAWDGLGSFLGDKVQEIRELKTQSTPKPMGPAVILEKGVFSGIHYWRVKQDIYFPKAAMEIEFIVTVIETNPYAGSDYVIQSISMKKEQK